jgi:membrane protein implicated in regulation of membrane protease activity
LSAIGFLTAWANAPFAIAAGIAGLFALLQVSGVLGLIAGGDHADGHEPDADVEHDVDHDVDHDMDHDADQDHDHDADGGEERSLAASALAPLGFGKIPFSMIWQTFCLVFAATGFALNFPYLRDPAGLPVHTLAWTLPAGAVLGYVGVALFARLLGPVLSSKGQEATSRAQLVGQIGVVISTKVDEEFGEVRIRDRTGHDIRVVCKLAKGAKRTPRETQNVVVVDCEDGGELRVEALDDEDDEDENDASRPSASRSGNARS